MRKWISPYLLVRIEQVFESFKGYIVQDRKTGRELRFWSVKGGKPGPVDLLPPYKRNALERKRKQVEERKVRNERIIAEYGLRKPATPTKPSK